MSCPQCGLRQWSYDEVTLTCKSGHRFKVGKRPTRFNPVLAIPATVAATVAADLLIRTII